jgi:translation initiation factor 2 subunit 1
MEISEGDIVLCTVDRIISTIVFVKIHGTKPEKEGSITFSEVSPGKIRNIREYVVPKKRIVCKVLRVSSNGHIDLSLRRITKKEEKETKEEFEKERSYKNIFKKILGKEAEKIIEDVEKEQRFSDFILEIKKDSQKFKKLIEKEKAKKILTILNSQKQKKFILKKEFTVSTTLPNGIILIKKILSSVKDVEITYLSAGKYSIKAEDSNIKQADNKIKNTLQDLKKQAEKQKINLSFEEKQKLNKGKES